MGFEHFHVGKAGAPFRHAPNKTAAKAKRAAGTADPSCATGAFYSSPALGSSLDSLTPLNIQWKSELDCLPGSPSLVDILLYAPGAATPIMHSWTGVAYAPGNYTVNLAPKWWNATEKCSLQLMVIPTNTPPFLSTIPAGPVFTATYAAPAAGASVPAAADLTSGPQSGGSTVVTATALAGVSTHSMSAGKKAAAVLLPLIFVLLLGLAYLKVSRARGAAKRSAWSEKLDKRMSTISQDWKAITPGGAKEAVRQSIAHSRNSVSVSVFAFGAINPPAVEGEPVVMGEKASVRGGSIEISEKDLPRTSLGSGVGVGVGARRPRTHANTTERGSRAVSFADAAHPRPSMSSAYSRGSRAFHTGSTYNDFADGAGDEAPPVPALPSPSRISAFGGGGAGDRGTAYSANTTYSANSTHNNTGHGHGGQGQTAVYGNAGAWSSGERVEGVDGGYGAQSVSPTGRVHTINYPETQANANWAYGSHNNNNSNSNSYQNDGSYFSPTTPTPGASFAAYGEDPSADSAYAVNTFGAPGAYAAQQQQEGGSYTSPRQTAGPLTLTPDDIRRRMTSGPNPNANNPNAMNAGNNNGAGQWRQSVDEVFGALSMMRTGTEDDNDNDGGEYLFAPPVAETVFAYPGTPAAATSSFNSTPASPFAMPMSTPTMSPDAMLRAYATKKHASSHGAPTGGAEIVPTLKNTGMRVLYKQPEDEVSSPSGSDSGSEVLGGAAPMIRAGPGARISR